MKNNILVGTVMLETMWRTRKKDLMDLISPFVYYSVASICAPWQLIDLQKVLEKMRTEFGYPDINISVIEKVLKRDPDKFEKG